MLLGRARELKTIDEMLAKAGEGRSTTLVVAGEAGIGKTALLEEAVRRADGLTVIRTVGVESESELAFSGISGLLRPLLHLLPQIPEPQHAALSSVLALGPPVPIDQFTAYAGVLSLLATAAEERPLLCAVDDVHWIDAASQQALVFASRRLGAEGVALLVARRDGEPTSFAQGGFPELALHGLPVDSARELVSARRPDVGVDAATLERLVDASAGNPLALVEATDILTDAQLAGREGLEEPIAFGAGVERAFAARFDSLDDDARRAVLIAAAGDILDSATLVTAIGEPPASDALVRAEQAGLMSLSEGLVRFRHPLVRSAVYQTAGPEARRDAHASLASALPDDPLRQAWHLAMATTGPDETVAARLEAVADEARARGGYLAAARALERAARLSEDSSDRGRRLLASASDSILAGRVERAFAILDETAELPLDAAARIQVSHLRARAELFGGDPMTSHQILVELAEDIEKEQPDQAAMLLAEACLPCLATAQGRLGLKTAERAYALAANAAPETRVTAALILMQALFVTGEIRRSELLLDEYLPVIEAADPFEAVQFIQGPTLNLIYLERFDEARRLVSRVLSAARSSGALSMIVVPLGCVAELEYRIGNWTAALAASTEATRIGTETMSVNLPYFLAVLARLEAARGHEAEARELTAKARALAGEKLSDAIFAYSGLALGLLGMGLARYDDVVVELEPVAQFTKRNEVDNPAMLLWHADLIEAYVRLGRTTDAERILERLEAAAVETGRTPQAAALRCRGILASKDEFEAHFLEAIRVHQETNVPFELARTELSFGERLRRAGRRADARLPLRSALATFERLGAAPWAEHARGELRSTGEAAQKRVEAPTESLTAHELQVALAVAEGATNKEVAARLFVSPKTIDFHLRNIYRKLDIRSRTELARLIPAAVSD